MEIISANIINFAHILMHIHFLFIWMLHHFCALATFSRDITNLVYAKCQIRSKTGVHSHCTFINLD